MSAAEGKRRGLHGFPVSDDLDIEQHITGQDIFDGIGMAVEMDIHILNGEVIIVQFDILFNAGLCKMENLIVIGRTAVEFCFICRKVSLTECLIGILLDADGNGSHFIFHGIADVHDIRADTNPCRCDGYKHKEEQRHEDGEQMDISALVEDQPFEKYRHFQYTSETPAARDVIVSG